MKLINLPNIITCCNLVCGCLSIYHGFHGNFDWACIYIILGALFDFFDGMTARALHISGPIGKELDSLADMVSFGFAPSVLAYLFILSFNADYDVHFFALAMVMTAFSALRLAKFNCDERQSLSFIGMPTPANAILWIGITSLNQIDSVHSLLADNALVTSIVWSMLILGLSILLICELPMFSLKIKPGHMTWAENKVRYTFLALCVCIIVASAVMGCLMASFAPIIILYIVFSILDAVNSKN